MKLQLTKFTALALALSMSVLPGNVSAKPINEENIGKNTIEEMSITSEKSIDTFLLKLKIWIEKYPGRPVDYTMPDGSRVVLWLCGAPNVSSQIRVINEIEKNPNRGALEFYQKACYPNVSPNFNGSKSVSKNQALTNKLGKVYADDSSFNKQYESCRWVWIRSYGWQSSCVISKI